MCLDISQLSLSLSGADNMDYVHVEQQMVIDLSSLFWKKSFWFMISRDWKWIYIQVVYYRVHVEWHIVFDLSSLSWKNEFMIYNLSWLIMYLYPISICVMIL